MKNKNGITLIALIITIIIMLILVGVTINFALNGGIINKAKEATIQTEIAMIKEQLMLKKAEIIADNMGDVPENGYGLSSISDLDGLSTEIISKYNSKLTISPDGTLYYLEDNVTGEEKVYFENAGITSSQGQAPTQSDVEYFVFSFTDSGNSIDQVFEVDYDNGTIKVYAGLANSNLDLMMSLDDFEFSNESFDIYLDDVRTTISNATSMSIDGVIGAYKQGNRLYFGEENENDLSSFSSDQYATLVPNFDTTRLASNSQESSSSSESSSEYPKAYGPDYFGMIFILTSDSQIYGILNDTIYTEPTIEQHKISDFDKTFTTDASLSNYGGNGTLVYLDSSTDYLFIMNNNGPAYVYDDSLDIWYGYIGNNTYYSFFNDPDYNLTLYTGDISSYLAQIEAMNNGN